MLNSTIIKPKTRLSIVKEDHDDNKIIECAVTGKADYIITKDKHLLKIKNYKGIKIITPREFLRIMALKKANNLAKKSKLTKKDVEDFSRKVKKSATKKYLKD
jgi:predicted nucleic acid-binding protein